MFREEEQITGQQIINDLRVNKLMNRHAMIQSGASWADRIRIINNNFKFLTAVRRFYKKVPNESPISRREYYKCCISQVNPNLGLWLSFGVHTGKRERVIIEYKNLFFPELVEEQLHGFDSFQGLPEYWKPGFRKGAFKLEKVPEIDQCVIHVGWFKDTLPVFREENLNKSISMMHVDCDLYSSTAEIFENMAPLIVPGTIILFDEIQGDSIHIEHEKKAFDEFVLKYEIKYEWFALVVNASQAACRIKDIKH